MILPGATAGLVNEQVTRHLSNCEVVVAGFNAHGGVDGWGRPFDLCSAVAKIDADVLVLAEAWSSNEGQSLVESIGKPLGYSIIEAPMGMGIIRQSMVARVDKGGPTSWGPGMRPGKPGTTRSLVLGNLREEDSLRATSQQMPEDLAPGGAQRRETAGVVALAMLSRIPIISHRIVNLVQLRGDTAHRTAIDVTVKIGGSSATVTGTHLGHLSRGSRRQMKQLSALLSDRCEPGVLAGDFNCWGPLLVAHLRGWRRAVKGRTWPAWRPHSQVDHVLVNRAVHRTTGAVLPDLGSDHRCVRAILGW